MKHNKDDTDQRGSSDMRLSDEDLRGRTIVSAEGQTVGEVTGLFFDSSAWRVESLQVKLRKEIADRLGVNRNVFRAGALEIPVSMVQAVGDTIVLSTPVEGLSQVLPSGSETHPAELEGEDAHDAHTDRPLLST